MGFRAGYGKGRSGRCSAGGTECVGVELEISIEVVSLKVEEEPTDMHRISSVREMVGVLLKLLACNVEDNWGHVEYWQRELKEVPYPEGKRRLAHSSLLLFFYFCSFLY